MREVVKRDPYIKISALSRGAPATSGTGQSQPGNFWTTDMQQNYTAHSGRPTPSDTEAT